MSTYPPFAIPTLIPADTNTRTSRVELLYPKEVIGSYLSWKLPVRAVSTLISITLSGLQTIDDVVLAEGDRILVTSQTSAIENGIYIVRALANWIRTNDLEDGSSAANISIFINEGTVNGGSLYYCTNLIGDDIVGVDDLVFVNYGTSLFTAPEINIMAGSGTESGNITLVASAAGVVPGYILFETNNIVTTITNGGLRLTKDILTVPDLSAPPTVTSTGRQGVIVITDPSALLANSSITLTVDNINVLNNDNVNVSVNQFNTGGNGIPMVLVSSITTGVGFTIELYNLDGAALSNSELRIFYVLL